MKILIQIFLTRFSSACEIETEIKSPSLYEPVGYLQEDSIILYNSCHLHSTHCSVFLQKYSLSLGTWSKTSTQIEPGFGYTWTYSTDLYVYSGRSVGGDLFTGLSIWKSEKSLKIDSKSKKKPSPRSYSCIVSFFQFLILFGGESLNGEENDVWAFDIESKEWQEIHTKGDPPSRRRGHSCVVYTSENIYYLLVFGGISADSYLNDLAVLKITLGKNTISAWWISHEFKVQGEVPAPREGSALVLFKSKPCLSLGCNYKSSICFSDSYLIDFSKASIVFRKLSFDFTPQEKVLVVPNNNQFYLFPGHSITNKLIKTGYIVTCPLTCSNHGNFVDDLCLCDQHFFGVSCEIKCVYGVFNLGVCQCDPGFALPTCENTEIEMIQTPCVHNCHNRGSCLNGMCHCLPEYFGINCEQKYCDSNCGSEDNRGYCDHNSGKCACQEKFGGDKCQFFCPFGCPEGLICIHDYQCACHNCPISAMTCNEHGTLIDTKCHCIDGYCGQFCQDKCENCHGHGKFNGACCECFLGYYGEKCQNQCKDLCSSHGNCEDGKCLCLSGWEGEVCDIENRCEKCVHGVCIDRKCECFRGYAGSDCSILICPNNCTVLSYHYEVYGPTIEKFNSMEMIPSDNKYRVSEIITTAGYCNEDRKLCECYPGYSGNDCSISVCLNCVHGTCESGICVCKPNYSGENCDLSICKNNCSGNGNCINGLCQCSLIWYTEDCSVCKCRQGKCGRSGCECFEGFEGQFCDTSICEKCKHGVCVNNRCLCSKGYEGKYCENCVEESDCFHCTTDSECGHGRCVENTCLCQENYTGKSCETLICSGHGYLKLGTCICSAGFSGKDCSISLTCLNNCSLHGVCHQGKCFCEPEYEGDDCSKSKTCAENCNLNGKCKLGKCFCFSGFQGPTCLPPKTCENCQGLCISGKCICEEPIKLIETQSECPLNCNNRGKCVENLCVCQPDWTGEACELHILQDNSKFCMKDGIECSGNGICNNGLCFCRNFFSGVYCEIGCENCGFNQVCVDGACRCKDGWVGEKCDEKDICLMIDCGEFGECFHGTCLCQYGYSSVGADPCVPAFIELAAVGIFVSVLYAAVLFLFLRINSK